MVRVHRESARVLPVSADGEVLLLQDTDPGNPSRGAYWTSIGGAIDPGEDAVGAAARELWEEAGIRVQPEALVGPVQIHADEYSWNGVDYSGHNAYFALVLDRQVEVSFANLEPIEVGSVVQAGWWTPDKLRAEGTATPGALPDIMEIAIKAVRGES
ncbi:NUDIX hydrolase [Nocardioides sp. NPDC087217]|uniref:NUDIX hydrolase n=1 Tax=Nocardioides sp. NPDC087217 TaxID=3364335 RepID=UPI00381AD9CA